MQIKNLTVMEEVAATRKLTGEFRRRLSADDREQKDT